MSGEKHMWKLMIAGISLAIGTGLIVQGIRCSIAVKEGINRLSGYEAKTIRLDYGDMTYVDMGAGEVILSVHGIFGGYDQAFDTCNDFASDIWTAMFWETGPLPNRQRRMLRFWTNWKSTRYSCLPPQPEAASPSDSPSTTRNGQRD